MGLKHALLVLAAPVLLLTACDDEGDVENGTAEVGVTHGTFEDGT